MFVWKDKNKQKEPGDGPFKISLHSIFRHYGVEVKQAKLDKYLFCNAFET